MHAVQEKLSNLRGARNHGSAGLQLKFECVSTMRRRVRSHLRSTWVGIMIGLQLSARDVEAGTCENLVIPMETVDLGEVGNVCKVKECATSEYNEQGIQTCIKCDQSGNDPTSLKYVARTEFCPLQIGTCDGSGRCVPAANDFYENNFGKPWTGLNTWKAITATHYGGDMACGSYPGHSDVNDVEDNCFHKIGIDGVAAVPSQMFGSGSSSAGCFKFNNLCYRLVGYNNITRIVALVDRCGGYAQVKAPTAVPDITEAFYFFPHENANGVTSKSDANACFATPGCQFLVGLSQRCEYYTDGTPYESAVSGKCCPGACGGFSEGKGWQVDWCASQSHPHFDVSAALLDTLCSGGTGGGIAAGSCALTHVEAMECPLWPKPGKCCSSASADCGTDCPTNTIGNCGQREDYCVSCGGKWCPGDDWQDICNNVTPPVPSTRPPDSTPSSSGTSVSTPPRETTTPPIIGTVAPPPKEEGGDKTGIIAGAAAAAAVVAAAAAAAALRPRKPPPPLDAAFEGEEEVGAEAEAREAQAQAVSQDFQG